MKKIIFAIAIAAMSTQAFAIRNTICEAKQDQREYDNCYNLSINGGMIRMKGNYERILASSKVPQKEKDYVVSNHAEWLKDVEKLCKTDSVCFYDHLSNRGMQIESYMAQYGIPSM